VARGAAALYHHFGGKGALGGKEGLFAALYEEVQREVAARIREAAKERRDAWSALKAGCHAFLDACVDPTVRRVMLLDAPAVLGWEHWREVDARHGLGLLKEGLREAMEEGAIGERPVDPITHLLVGAINEAAMWIARSGETGAALRQVGESLDELLEGLRATSWTLGTAVAVASWRRSTGRSARRRCPPYATPPADRGCLSVLSLQGAVGAGECLPSPRRPSSPSARVRAAILCYPVVQESVLV